MGDSGYCNWLCYNLTVSQDVENFINNCWKSSWNQICNWKTIDLSNQQNLISVVKKNIWFAVYEAIKDLKQKDVFNATGIKKFMEVCQLFLATMVRNLLAQSPVGSTFWKTAGLFDLEILFEIHKEK